MILNDSLPGQKLFPPSLEVVVQEVDIDDAQLASATASCALLARNVAAVRRAEFRAGRQCTGEALRRLGVQPVVDIPHDENRAPVWPSGVVGSISHSSERAIAVVGQATRVHALGVDLMLRSENIGTRQYHLFCTAAELEVLLRLPDAQRHAAGLALLSAKEAVFKCVCHATGDCSDMRRIAIDWQRGEDGFIAHILRGKRLMRLHGRQLRKRRHLYSGVSWHQDSGGHDSETSSFVAERASPEP